jgi:hypothetical protein
MKSFSRSLAVVIFSFLLVEIRGWKHQQHVDKPTEETIVNSYGLDVSFPARRPVSTNYPWLPHNQDPVNNPTPEKYQDMPMQPLGDRHKIYVDMLHGCRKAYPENSQFCDYYELQRMLMNQRQPVSMINYTRTGFLKTQAPSHVVKLVNEFWNSNHFKGALEEWVS